MSDDLKSEMEREERKLEQALNETLEETIRTAWLPNTAAWLGVVVGGFLLNLVILVAIAGS
jgi:hypothetical protein